MPGHIFARGVAGSSLEADAEYERETRALRAALDSALDAGQTLVYFAGAPIYGSFAKPVHEEQALRPVTRYGRHQAESEDVIRSSGANYLSLRLPNVVGPDRHQLVPAFVHQVLDGNVTLHVGAGRDLIDVRDVVQIAQRLLALPTTNLTINLATGICTPVYFVAEEIARTLRRSPTIRWIDGGEAQHFDVRALVRLLGGLPFDALYPERTLRQWVPLIAEKIEASPPPRPPTA